MNTFQASIWHATGPDDPAGSDAPAAQPAIHVSGAGSLPSIFAVSDLAAASVGCAGAALAEWIQARFNERPDVHVDRRLASLWFSSTLLPVGWALEADRDPVTGDYATRDGWIRLHANAHHHRAAALSVLGASADKADVAAAVSGWDAEALEQAIVDAGGCAARMRSLQQWADHPQGRALRGGRLLELELTPSTPQRPDRARRDRPLAGYRVLDLTRVLAGPVCTRLLAGMGADVLRIDPVWWQEPGLEPETTLGKHCATLDLRSTAGLAHLRDLIAQADVLVHGWRPGALPGLGLDAASRRALNPGLTDVSLDAYGWAGPWQGRRGFDSLVQMSMGIAHEGMTRTGADRPVPLPVQALDHATGYILACAALRGLTRRLTRQTATTARASLAQTGALLVGAAADPSHPPLQAACTADYATEPEHTPWGEARRMTPPLAITGAALRWDRTSRRFRSDPAQWAPA